MVYGDHNDVAKRREMLAVVERIHHRGAVVAPAVSPVTEVDKGRFAGLEHGVATHGVGRVSAVAEGVVGAGVLIGGETRVTNQHIIELVHRQARPRVEIHTGRIINPGDFGRITSTSNNPRLVQFAVKLNF